MTDYSPAAAADLAALTSAALSTQAALDRLFRALEAPAPPRFARWPFTLAAGLLLALL